jgi:DNA repair protein RadC
VRRTARTELGIASSIRWRVFEEAAQSGGAIDEEATRLGYDAVKELNPRDRPREKLARAGAAALGDNELIAVLLGSGLPAHGALVVARDLLDLAGGAAGISRLGLDDLKTITGIGPSRAARVLAAVELGRRALAGDSSVRPRLATPAQVAAYLLPLFGGHRVERFGIVLLDAKRRLIRATILSVGSVDTSVAHPREVYREAILASAAAVVAFHNHPSGDPLPSSDDIALTSRLMQAGQMMGIDLVDHIILGDGRWYSFKDAYRLQKTS